MLKIILVVIAVLVGLALLYAYVKYLFEEGYEEDEVYLHLFHDVPLRYLRRNRRSYTDYADQAGYRKRKKEHETVDPDSYPSAYGWNCDPEVVALMNTPPADQGHDEQLLREGGWQYACGKVHARYVSSCSCGRNKEGEQPPEPVSVQGEEASESAATAAIREYKKLLDEGILTPEEFEAKKRQLLDI